MDSMISAAARALAAGDPLGALRRVALRNDAASLALRGIAMAQLGDLARAKALLRSAARAFGPKESVARARCVVAEAEIALVSRDLKWAANSLEAARAILEAHGDRLNAAHARYIQVRRLLLIGHIEEADSVLSELAGKNVSPALRTVHELAQAGIALRRLRARDARTALRRAARAALDAKIPALSAEVDSAARALNMPAARLFAGAAQRLLTLEDVEDLLASSAFIIDGCRHVVRQEGKVVSLAKRPVLFALLAALGEAWPHDVPRDALIARAFRTRINDESYRARLRVEIGRLRNVLKGVAQVKATKGGFGLSLYSARRVAVLALPIEEKHAALLALLADGEAWSSSGLALALGTGQRTVQRVLEALATAGKVQSFGRGRTQRWMAPQVPGFTTALLLPAALSVD